MWLRSAALSRLRHFQAVRFVMPRRSAKIRSGSSPAWIAWRE